MAQVDDAAGLGTILMTLYAWSGAVERAVLKDRTNALIRAVRVKLGTLRQQPVLLSINLTGEPEDFSEMADAINRGEL